MKLNFSKRSLLGSFFSSGSIKASSDGSLVLCPTSNGITIYDLKTKAFSTLPIDSKSAPRDYSLNHKNNILVCLDEDQQCSFYHPYTSLLLAKVHVSKCAGVAFSPTSNIIATHSDREVVFWSFDESCLSNSPLTLKAKAVPFKDVVSSLSWDSCGEFILATSIDQSMAIIQTSTMSILQVPRKRSSRLINAAFWQDQSTLFVLALHQDNVGYIHSIQRFKSVQTHQISLETSTRDDKHSTSWLESAAFETSAKVLSTCHSNGTMQIFKLLENNSLSLLHSLSVSTNPPQAMAMPPFSTFTIFGCSKDNSLAAWDWSSECYLFKQHFQASASLAIAYCPFNPRILAAASADGRINFFNTRTGFLQNSISSDAGTAAIVFSGRKNRMACSVSTSGHITAYDAIKYKAFRKVDLEEAASPLIALNPSADMVIVPSAESWEIRVVDLQQSKVIDSLSGHSGPISAVGFDPSGSAIWSSSWDKTVRIWNLFSASKPPKILSHKAEVTFAAIRPDGRELASCTLDGTVNFWSLVDEDEADPTVATLLRSSNFLDSVRIKKKHESKMFGSVTCMKYSVDGALLFITGKFPFVAIFDPIHMTLIRKLYLPPKWGLENRTLDVSADSDEIAVSCGGSVVIFSADYSKLTFDPSHLEVDITPERIKELLAEGQFCKAICASIRLNVFEVVRSSLLFTPLGLIATVSQELPLSSIRSILKYLPNVFPESSQLETMAEWIDCILRYHGVALRQSSDFSTQTTVKIIHKLVEDLYKPLSAAGQFSISNLQSQ